MNLFESILRLILLGAGLTLPGLGWALASRWPLPWFIGGVISALSLFTGVLVFEIIGVPITLLSLSLFLTLIGVLGWGRYRRVRIPSPTASSGPSRSFVWMLIATISPMLLVATWRAITQPLSGADTSFRWNLLAELIHEYGHFNFYPATTVSDFSIYFWADGIAPLVSSLYSWSYLAADSLQPTWTAPVVLIQFAGLITIIFALGKQLNGPRAGAFAIALAGGTMLLQFAFNLGQETGLTALGVAGTIYYATKWRDSSDTSSLIPAALCASLAACAREYGPAIILVTAFWITTHGRSYRPAFRFILIASFLPAIWHLRVALMTGNPWFAHDIMGLPTNPVFSAWMSHYREIYQFAIGEISSWQALGRYIALTALPATVGLFAGIGLGRKHSNFGLSLATSIVFIIIWISSISSTAGGLFYSMRVLSPVLLLGCAWGGAGLARIVSSKIGLSVVVIALAIFNLDASLRALTIPLNPYSTPFQEWGSAGDRWSQEFEDTERPFLQSVAAHVEGRTLSDCAGLRPIFAATGKTYSPFWSPDVAWIFESKSVSNPAQRLRDLGFSHVLIKRSSLTIDFLVKTGAEGTLDGILRPVMANDLFVLLAIVPAEDLTEPQLNQTRSN